MRIIAGYLKGRIFDSPKNEHTHPMGDKIRGALFNVLGDIDGLNVLDAFAGSGAIGFEAISRGAASVTLIETDRAAQITINSNIHKLGLEKTTILVKSNANAWLSSTYAKFNIVILDPPYGNLQENTVIRLADRTEPNGILVLSLPPAVEINLPDKFRVVSTKSYGDARLRLYRSSES